MALGMLGQMGGAALGIGLQNYNNSQSMEYNKEMADYNMKNQKELANYYNQMSLDKWNKTNAEAQRKHLEKAGLNIGLMYKQSGVQGQSQVTQGNAGGGNEPNQNLMGIGMQSGIQAMQTQSQIELNKAQAEKLKSEASSIRGEKGTIGESQINNTKVQTELSRLYLEIGNATKSDQIDRVTYEVESIIKNNNLTDEQVNNVIADTLQKGIENNLTNAKIGLTQEQTSAIGTELKQGWEKINVALQGLEIQNQSNKLRGLEGKTRVQEIKQNYMVALMQNSVAWGKLNIEQQKVLVSMMGNIVGLSGSKTTTQKYDSNGGTSTTESTTTKY